MGTPAESMKRVNSWVEGLGLTTYTEVARSGSAYLEIEDSEGERLKVRFSDHSAELSSYHWGKSDDVDFDVTLRGGSGEEYSDGHSATDAVMWLSSHLGAEPPGWAKAARSRELNKLQAGRDREALRDAQTREWEQERIRLHAAWLSALPPDQRGRYESIYVEAESERGKRRKRLRGKLRALEKAAGFVWLPHPESY